MKKVLVTGGAGYIGSHTCKRLAKQGYVPIVYDSLVHGHRHSVRWGPLVVGDIRDQSKLEETLREYQPEAVIHFAALAYVGESVLDPAKYYLNNVGGTLSLLNAMKATGVTTLVFSSTCATYGIPKELPISEDSPQNPINPYGRSKLMIEQILADYRRAYGLKYAALRYFNACGADPEGELGEWHDPETHLIPRALLAVMGKIPHVDLYGEDYPTPDGSCIRDYIHVMDLADGHIKSLSALQKANTSFCINLGTGKGYSVHEVLSAIARVTGREVPVKKGARREGDPPSLYANPSKGQKLLGLQPQFSDLDTILSTAWSSFAKDKVSRS